VTPSALPSAAKSAGLLPSDFIVWKAMTGKPAYRARSMVMSDDRPSAKRRQRSSELRHSIGNMASTGGAPDKDRAGALEAPAKHAASPILVRTPSFS
jgi:hypothetical protein